MAGEWAEMFDSYDAFEAAHPAGWYLTTFEALTGAATKEAALAELLHVLGVPPANGTDAGDPLREQQPGSCSAAPADARLRGYDPQRIGCAFEMAAHPAIYRPKDPAGVDMVFAWEPRLVCDVWARVGRRAAAHGYAPFGGAAC